MAEAVASKPVYLFYHIQNEKGEASAHPNACKLNLATPGKVTLNDVLTSFPLTGTSSFHFRFQHIIDKQIVFIDLTNPSDVVPQVNGSVICKILRLAPASAPAVTARTAAPSNSSSAGARPPVQGGVTSVAAPPVSSPIVELKPVKQVELSPVAAPEVVDDDLRDKSAYVQAKVMERRVKLQEEQARRIAEIEEREAAAKKDQEDSETARTLYGPKLKEWAEEASGAKKNIRILISTMQNALWPEAKWEPVPMAKLIDPRRVKIAFLKAVTIVHPDKQTSMDPLHKFIATQIFHYIESAFRTFQETEMGGTS